MKMNPASTSLKTSKLHNLKAGYGDGVIILLDWTGVLMGTLCDRKGRQHCFMGRQVVTGDITDFFSETRTADRSSYAYQTGRITGILTGAAMVYGMPFLPIATAAANGMRYLYRYDDRVVEENRREHPHQ